MVKVEARILILLLTCITPRKVVGKKVCCTYLSYCFTSNLLVSTWKDVVRFDVEAVSKASLGIPNRVEQMLDIVKR